MSVGRFPAWGSRYDSRLSNTSRILIDSDFAARASALVYTGAHSDVDLLAGGVVACRAWAAATPLAGLRAKSAAVGAPAVERPAARTEPVRGSA